MEFLIFSDDDLFPLNKEKLKELYFNGNLKGADIFAELFKLNNSAFKEEEMIKDKLGYISLCKFLNINGTDWNIFLSFIKHGKLLEEENIEILNKISNKFGGIPAIDNYYNKIVNLDKYNPINPKEDYKKKYIWKASHIYDAHKNLKDFEFASSIKENKLDGIFRKLKQ